MRYHWLTLVALFLALGLGIVIGTGLGERGTLWREQARLAEQLEASLNRLREENQALRRAGEELARDLEAVQAIAETIAWASVPGRLAGRTVYLVVSDAPGLAARWEALLERAGATVVRQAIRQGGGQGGGEGADGPRGFPAGTRGFPADGGAMALYVNPPPNVPIPDGLRAAVVWDGHGLRGSAHGEGEPGAADAGGMALPSDWLVVRAGQGALAEWTLVEGMRGGWSGYVDAAGPAAALHGRLGDLVGAGAGGGSR